MMLVRRAELWKWGAFKVALPEFRAVRQHQLFFPRDFILSCTTDFGDKERPFVLCQLIKLGNAM